MGWRYLLIILGGMTLLVFFLRFFVFNFHESPKYLLARGREAEAIEVLHRIAKFNRQPPPTLTLEHFAEIDAAESSYKVDVVPQDNTKAVKHVVRNFFRNFKHLKGLFGNKLQLFIFILLGIAYMVGVWAVGVE
jgi:hypothetical protein